ncbi:hypothetical protein AGABI2DRAFT_119143 [Agaricus bisporus var. bisporus H97]|uniref:hypothetical protein n=1 Tax=Agaricus bisporus var. bisporus (strain H97 / ATCC MYA-4626 / FGSC 10389) TaxID=936046 RepID=UPI00029F54C8|nr:hypothetical protein AGABI2DRAFT_119143 [Agaricus bisporus var. bisporus H97]EKV46968.1 hypothetical protein AGABI2DRAFT_119143 [Agaricus bisporus var. bisporus H97]
MSSTESHYRDPLRDQSSITSGKGRRPKVIAEPQSTTQQLYKSGFLSRNADVRGARNLYAKILVGGIFMIIIIIFTIFPILYGAFYKTPARNLDGWVVDYDDGLIGQSVIAGLMASNQASKISWAVVSKDRFRGGPNEVSNAVSEHKTWIAVTINSGASTRLTTALENPDPTYDGSQAISIFASEARNENAFRALLLPSVQNTLMVISDRFALQQAQAIANSSVLPQLMTTAPRTVLLPISFQLFNIHPFNQPLASVVVTVGLIFVLILSFFVVMIQHGARETTNIPNLLNLRSLVILRLTSSFFAYFFVSLFLSLLSLAFQLDFTKKFGHAGFFIYWMLILCGMCAMGLALESMLTLLTLKLIPFFLLLWLMLNVSVSNFPIEILPIFYRFGYALPFYHISKAVRTIVFGTKNQIGFDFAVLLIWTVISCISLTLFQFVVRRREVINARRKEAQDEMQEAGKAEASS